MQGSGSRGPRASVESQGGEGRESGATLIGGSTQGQGVPGSSGFPGHVLEPNLQGSDSRGPRAPVESQGGEGREGGATLIGNSTQDQGVPGSSGFPGRVLDGRRRFPVLCATDGRRGRFHQRKGARSPVHQVRGPRSDFVSTPRLVSDPRQEGAQGGSARGSRTPPRKGANREGEAGPAEGVARAVASQGAVDVDCEGSLQTLRVLYLYAGAPRKADVESFLKTLCEESSIKLDFWARDLLRSGMRDDILDDVVWTEVKSGLANGDFDVLIVSPPCNTHTRAVWANPKGPVPVRDFLHPQGFPWLRGPLLAKCEAANILVDRSFEAILVGYRSPARTRHLLEHPEDLGVVRTGDRPASIWQDPHHLQIIKETGAQTGALHQCRYPGALSKKPTRITSDLKGFKDFVVLGWPTFDKLGRYVGPLPRDC